MKYKLVIFDFDGTLADSFPWLTGVVDRVAEKFQFPKIPKSEHGLLRNYDAKKLLKHLGLPLWKALMISNHMRKMMNEEIHTIPLFEGVDHLLTRLHEKKVELAIVSSNSTENVLQVIGQELVAKITYFECGVSIFSKSSKLRKVLSKSGIPAKEVIYIGDEIRDIEAARHVGISSGAVAWGYNTIESLSARHPTELFYTVKDIEATLID
ncbi:MAG: HAD hydrolase-like protein [Candidatus Marinimicrobia bacterium]|nr:HAD hydrolase-like protein [Candidatus Neomarinimicrobiota bacterium]